MCACAFPVRGDGGEGHHGLVEGQGPQRDEERRDDDGPEHARERDTQGLQGDQLAARGQAGHPQEGAQQRGHGEGHGDDLRQAVEEEARHDPQGDALFDDQSRRLEEQVARHEDQGEDQHPEHEGTGDRLQDEAVQDVQAQRK